MVGPAEDQAAISVYAEALDQAAVGDMRIGTDEHSPSDIADAIVTRTGWPDRMA